MYQAVIIGGSAGSFRVITSILHALPKNYPIPLLLNLHRLKHVRSGFVEALSIKSNIPVMEPYDKEAIKSGIAYLAPSNYHMYIELNKKIALSTEETVNHSRPSIDLSFATAAQTYHRNLLGIILSGANKDGAWGLKKIKDAGGTAMVQDPEECEVSTMSQAAMNTSDINYIYNTNQIIDFLLKIK